MNNTEEMKLFYEKLLQIMEIQVMETDVRSKGLIYPANDGKDTVCIRKNIDISEKIKVLLHECAHYIHLSKYYENEDQAECEIIAQASAFFICKEINLDIVDNFMISNINNEKEDIKRLSGKIKQIKDEVIATLKYEVL